MFPCVPAKTSIRQSASERGSSWIALDEHTVIHVIALEPFATVSTS